MDWRSDDMPVFHTPKTITSQRTKFTVGLKQFTVATSFIARSLSSRLHFGCQEINCSDSDMLSGTISKRCFYTFSTVCSRQSMPKYHTAHFLPPTMTAILFPTSPRSNLRFEFTDTLVVRRSSLEVYSFFSKLSGQVVNLFIRLLRL